MPAASIAAAIFWLSSHQSLPLEPLFPGFDKIQHAVAYGIFAVAIALGWWHSGHRHRALLLRVTILAAALYGISDEWHQSFVPGRDCDIWDWVADTAGAVCGATVFYRWIQRRHR